jgi:hypothetical protein
MSYLRYLCLLVYIGVQRILCCVFLFVLFSLSCVPYFPTFSGLSNFECPFDIP